MTAKVLIVDDEEKLRSLVARLLRLEGYVVTEAGSLKAARNVIEAQYPDIILCDVKLPDGNGVDEAGTLVLAHFNLCRFFCARP